MPGAEAAEFRPVQSGGHLIAKINGGIPVESGPE